MATKDKAKKASSARSAPVPAKAARATRPATRTARGPTTVRSTASPAVAPAAAEPLADAIPASDAPVATFPPSEAPPAAEVANEASPPGPAAADSETPTRKPGDEPDLDGMKRRIAELEAELARLAQAASADEAARRTTAPPSGADDAASTGDLLPPGYYMRHWGRQGLRSRAEEIDEFGLDATYEARWRPVFDFLYRHYFRVDTEGAAHVPAEGRCLLVSNHSGGPLPYDGIMLRTALRREHPEHRDLRWLAEDFVYHLPFVGTMMNRLGAVRACPENAERLLAGGRAVAVFPEGAKGIGKLYRDRYRLQRFGRGGFIRLALRTGTPVVPCAVIGAEEANPMLHRIEYMTKALGIPYLPVTPTFPLLGPLGLLPAPTKWRIRFGEAVSFEGFGPDAADDEILVGRLAERVRATIQGMVDAMIAERQSVWFG
jgi:1-acyl-sn-glycerol-3-phosphate acyltransferase